MKSFKKKALYGVGLITILKFFTQIIVIVKLSFLARILTPGDFGIFALLTTTITTLEALSDTGFNYAAIHMTIEIKKIAKSLLFVNVLRGIALSVLTIILAPLVASFFAQEILNYILIASLIPLMKGFINPLIVTFQKDLNFQKIFLFHFISVLANTIFSVLFVILLNNILGLIYGLVLSTIVEIIASYLLIRSDFSHPIKRKYLKKLFSYGKWMTVGGIVTYLSTQIDNIVIGKLLGTQALGLYDFSYRTANIAFTQITDSVSQVAFPLYSKRKNNKQHILSLFKKNILVTSLIAFIITVPFIFFPRQILLILFGDQWVVASPVLQILAFYGFMRATIGPAGPLFLAVGRPDILTKLNTANFIFVVILIYPFVINAGLVGAALAMTISYLLIVPFYIFCVFKFFKTKI